MNLLDYTYEIIKIARARNVDNGVACNMLTADIANGAAQSFNTADLLPEIDFSALKHDWDALTLTEQTCAIDEWSSFYRANGLELDEAYAEGEDAVIALVEGWRDEHENN